MALQSNRYKIIVVGDANVGKTTFVERHLTGEFKKNYEPTLGVDVHPLFFNTNYGRIIFDVWDVGQEGLLDGYFTQANGTILFFDVHNIDSYKNLEKWYNDTKRVTGDVPVVVCGNKTDLKGRVVRPKQITFHRRHNAMYYDISARSNYNYEKPFLHLARQLTGHLDLEFVAQD